MDLPALMARKQSTVDQLVGGVEQLLRARRIALVRGAATLAKPDTLRVSTDKGVRDVVASRVILAPGSVIAEPPIEGRNLPGVMTSTQALEIDQVPPRLIVIGGGVIGMEFACIYEAFGSRVTVLEMAASVLPDATDENHCQAIVSAPASSGHGHPDRDHRAAHRTRRRGAAGRLRPAPLVKSCPRPNGFLLAVGRWPNTQGMGFSELGVKLNGRAIAVDEQLATSLPNVWAAGDAVGRLDAGAQGDGRGSDCRRERHGRSPPRRRPDHAQRHLHPAGNRQRRVDRGRRPAGEARM